MSIGLLLITHNDIGAELLATATRMLGHCPLDADCLRVGDDDDLPELYATAQTLAKRLDHGDGLLVLTDLYGSTPANIAHALADRHGVRVLAGINLPMLVRVLNYADLGLAAVTEKALSGGRDGVLPCRPGERL
jgi:PTS system ascorbate-specific IIA component